MAGPVRFELTTSGATGRCSFPLNYNPSPGQQYLIGIPSEYQDGDWSSRHYWSSKHMLLRMVDIAR